MAKAIDPVCKMEVDTANPPGGQSEYQGTTYYFCAPGCRGAFDKDQEGYLSGQRSLSMNPQKGSFISRILRRNH